jgi:hypothetical protein
MMLRVFWVWYQEYQKRTAEGMRKVDGDKETPVSRRHLF